MTSDVVYLSKEDEKANTITHAIGVLLSLIALVVFWNLNREFELGMRLCCLAFTLAMIAVYSFSTLSHAIMAPGLRNRMRAWDQGMIYFLIVGTYSPFVWHATQGSFRSGLLIVVWGLAMLGFYSKVFAKHRVNSVATITYLALGWLPAIPLVRNTPGICLFWMIMGGVCYSVGVIFLKNSCRARYLHATWHVFVMLGSGCHSYAIFRLLELI